MIVLKFTAVMLTALALAPGGAHLFALPNKIALPVEAYFVAQGIYRGWAMLGAVLIAAVIANFLLALAQYRRAERYLYALGAGLCLLLTLAIFFTWTFPANQATANWTVVPQDWEALRTQWEYSHAVNAGITFVALALVVIGSLAPRRG